MNWRTGLDYGWWRFSEPTLLAVSLISLLGAVLMIGFVTAAWFGVP